MSHEEKPRIRLLFINGSPRLNGNTATLVEEAVKGALSLEEHLAISIDRFDFGNKKVSPCLGCLRCSQARRCVLKDDFHEFAEKWLDADGLIYAYPVYHRGMTAQMKGAIDRLGHSVLSAYKKTPPRFLKAAGVITQGGSVHGGQDCSVTHVVEHIMLMRCVPVAAEAPEAKIGVIGHAPSWEKGSVIADEKALVASYNLGRRVTEMACMLQIGSEKIRDFAKPGYFRFMERL